MDPWYATVNVFPSQRVNNGFSFTKNNIYPSISPIWFWSGAWKKNPSITNVLSIEHVSTQLARLHIRKKRYHTVKITCTHRCVVSHAWQQPGARLIFLFIFAPVALAVCEHTKTPFFHVRRTNKHTACALHLYIRSITPSSGYIKMCGKQTRPNVPLVRWKLLSLAVDLIYSDSAITIIGVSPEQANSCN